MDCVIYSGTDHPCSNIAHGESISPIMMQALSLIFPIEECCYFEATVVLLDPPQYKYDFCYSIKDGSCSHACACDTTTKNVSLYSLSSTLSVGTILYADQALSIQAPAGWYGANGNCYTISGGPNSIVPGLSGALQSISPCTTTTSTTSTTTLAPCYCFTVTMSSTHTISYLDCFNVNRTSPLYTTGTSVDICAQLINANSAYSWSAPIKYCADRITCPTTTTTSTTTSTTTTTTLPPCNCITFTNYNTQATIGWTNCDGKNETSTIPKLVSETIPSVIKTCGSNGYSSGQVNIVVGPPCVGAKLAANCPTGSTTTAACSDFMLYCCGNLDSITSIKPCYPNATVPLAINNMYTDEQGRRWIVIGSGGTPTDTTYSPQLTYIGQSTLGNCQNISIGQLCPGVVAPTTLPVVKHLKYSDVDCIAACVSSTIVSVYSSCGTLSLNCMLYTDVGLTNPVTTVGYYSDGVNSFYVDNTGRCTSQSSCSQCTTAAPTTAAPTTANPNTIEIRNDVSGQQTHNAGLPVITQIGIYINGGIMALSSVTWTGGNFRNLVPGDNISGTYTGAPSGQLGMAISKTWDGATSGNGTPLQPSFTGTYYVRLYRNGQEIGCTPVDTSPSTPAPIALPSGAVYSTGDAIKIVLTKTGGGLFC
jgi:hypothetical protein